jgi:ligand-binding sensor domain-containing protein
MTPYFLSTYDHKTLYQAGNYLMKSTDRGDTWQAISPNLARSSVAEKKSVAAGTVVESPLAKGLLYVGTDHGAFWVSKNDGANWEEQSTGIASNYIRSISPSNHHLARVYMAMTGINYDDLHSYVYVSEDYGKNWKSIAAGLPDEPVNVIKEDPTNENILYAGTIRGVFVSTDRGSSWHYLGVNMPAAAVADLEIHEGSQDLVVATHGRGIYKTNLKPIQQGLAQKLPRDQDYLFEIDQVSRPWFNSSHGNVDYRTLQKVSFTYWLKEAKPVTLSVRDAANKEVWTTALNGSVGFNQFRWDLIVSKQESASPYFVHYDKFIDSGTYTLVLTTAEGSMQQKFRVVDGISPYLEN